MEKYQTVGSILTTSHKSWYKTTGIY